MASGQIAMQYGAKGPNTCLVTACATGPTVLGMPSSHFSTETRRPSLREEQGKHYPPHGRGIQCHESPFDPQRRTRKGFSPLRKESHGLCSWQRGAGILILEELEFARKRGAKIYGEVVGYGYTGDAYHITAPPPNGDGAIRCMRMAIRDARIGLRTLTRSMPMERHRSQ